MNTNLPGLPDAARHELGADWASGAAVDVFGAAVHMTRMAMVLSNPSLPDNPVVYCNPAFLAQTGYTEAEVIGRNCRFLQGPETDRATVARMSRRIAACQDVDEDIYNYRRDGRGYWNSLHISPIFDRDRKLLYFFASQIDISRRKEAELRQKQQSDVVGDIASGVAHAFNNLMTVVVASIDQAAQQTTGVRQALQLARAEQAARDAGRLTQQMLSFARRQFLEEHRVDVGRVVSGLGPLLAQVAGEAASVGLAVADGPPLFARLDPAQLERCLMALVRNSADATPQGGRIVVRSGPWWSFELEEGQTARMWVEVSVADDGVGMSPDVKLRAAEPFFTTRSDKAGLGLSMVQGFVQQSGGRLSVDTASGRGTTVRLRFPCDAGAAHGDGAPVPVG